MINFLHTYLPNPVLIELGNLKIHWYGLFMSLSMLVAIIVALKLADQYQINKELVVDAAFWLIIAGLVCARIWYVLIDFNYYLENPQNIIKIWEGGIAIHGAIIGGIVVLYYFTKKNALNFWQLASIIAPGVAIGQAIARWGNYFNQELYGRPTNLPWGIPIDDANKIFPFQQENFFHPAFLYESLGNLLIFSLLIALHYLAIKNMIINEKIKKNIALIISLFYLTSYSILRFFMEFIRIDPAVELFSLRLPQITSLIITLISAIILYITLSRKEPLEKN